MLISNIEVENGHYILVGNGYIIILNNIVIYFDHGTINNMYNRTISKNIINKLRNEYMWNGFGYYRLKNKSKKCLLNIFKDYKKSNQFRLYGQYKSREDERYIPIIS
jgi:hypothetical protein